jgi:hypothetical protein
MYLAYLAPTTTRPFSVLISCHLPEQASKQASKQAKCLYYLSLKQKEYRQQPEMTTAAAKRRRRKGRRRESKKIERR